MKKRDCLMYLKCFSNMLSKLFHFLGLFNCLNIVSTESFYSLHSCGSRGLICDQRQFGTRSNKGCLLFHDSCNTPSIAYGNNFCLKQVDTEWSNLDIMLWTTKRRVVFTSSCPCHLLWLPLNTFFKKKKKTTTPNPKIRVLRLM